MMDKVDFDKMISAYQRVMIEPLVLASNKLSVDEYDNIKFIYSYDPADFSVIFGAIRKRPDKYMIRKMFCTLVVVSMFDIERWYDGYMDIVEKSNAWEWEEQYK